MPGHIPDNTQTFQGHHPSPCEGQIRYYVPGIPRASAFLSQREYQVAIWLFVKAIDTVSDPLLVLLNRAATLSLTVSPAIIEVM
jgi:hypothetical protein